MTRHGSYPSSSILRWFAGALVVAGCVAQTSGKGETAPQTMSVAVVPDDTTIYAQQSYQFGAVATGTGSQLVDWSVQGGDTHGTITAGGLYTAPAVSVAADYTVVAASHNVPTVFGTATVHVLPQPPNGSAMTTAHRTAGVAPLGVFFDAVNTTNTGLDAPFVWNSGVFQPTDYEGADYVWNFGDPGAGSWGTSGRSKNTATGYTAAHVFENPGSYTVTLNVTDAAGTVHTYTQTITVSAFSGTTYYVAAAGADTNDGLSPSTPYRTIAKAMSKVGTNVRILFNRGDTFDAGNAIYAVTAPGPGLIGAYGTGARPILRSTYSGMGRFIDFSDAGSPPNGQDWRVTDLELVGGGGASYLLGRPDTRPTKNLLIQRNYLHGSGAEAIFWQPWGEWGMLHPDEGVFLVDNEVSATGMIGIYVGGRWIALMGNYVHDTVNHNVRIWQAHKACLNHNRFWNQGSQRHNLKLHAPSYGGDSSVPFMTEQPDTRFVTLTDNWFRSARYDTSTNPDVYIWSVSMGPQNGWNDERVSHVVYERNFHDGSQHLATGLESSASHAIVRNNVFTGTSTGWYYGIYWQWRGAGDPNGEPQPTNVRIYNNTVYSNTTVETAGFQISGDVLQCRVRNNLVVLTGGASTGVFASTGGTGFAQDHNVLVESGATPVFTNAGAADFSLVAGAPAVDAGVALTDVRLDWNLTSRPLGAGHDAGAHESR